MKIKTKSFKTKLWLYFMLFAAVIFLVLWLLQTVFLQRFYDGMIIKNTVAAADSIGSEFGSSRIGVSDRQVRQGDEKEEKQMILVKA